MPLQTRNTKKAPAKAMSSTKSKSGGRNGKTTKKATVTHSRKRAATESESEDEPTAKTSSRKQARAAKRSKRNEEEEEDVEDVEDINPVHPEIEVISDDEDLDANSPNENAVSKKKKNAKAHKSSRETGLTSINVGQSLKKNPLKRTPRLISSP